MQKRKKEKKNGKTTVNFYDFEYQAQNVLFAT